MGSRSRQRWLAFAAGALAAFSFASAAFADDATLYISPITGTYTNGDDGTLTVIAASGGQPVNAIEGKIDYNPKEIEVTNVASDDSVITSWTVPPGFDNDIGEISFGGLLATSTVLDRGVVLKFSFHVLRSGEIRVRFSSGAAMLAADGTGGNIISVLKGGIYNVFPKDESADDLPGSPPVEDAASTSSGEVLGAATTSLIITSASHPDQNAWYALSTSSLSWEMPPQATEVRLSLSKKPGGEGSNSYPATTTEKTITGIADGVWYFHVTRVYDDGSSDNMKYRLNIDTAPPKDVTLTERPRNTSTDPKAVFMVSATDTLSGLDHYEFTVDGGAPVNWTDDGSHVFDVPPTPPGEHTLVATAVDKAGNRASSSASFSIDFLPTPTISIVGSGHKEGETLKLDVSGVPRSTLSVFVAKDSSPVTEEVALDTSGKAMYSGTFVLSPGEYDVWAIDKDASGGTSEESAHLKVSVSPTFMGIVKRHPLVPVAGIVLIVLLGAAAWFMRRGRSGEGEEVYSDEPSWKEEAVDAFEEERPKRVVQGGAVVLGKRSGYPPLPATRL